MSIYIYKYHDVLRSEEIKLISRSVSRDEKVAHVDIQELSTVATSNCNSCVQTAARNTHLQHQQLKIYRSYISSTIFFLFHKDWLYIVKYIYESKLSCFDNIYIHGIKVCIKKKNQVLWWHIYYIYVWGWWCCLITARTVSQKLHWT